uniref:Uncharacterized protein n=1 Tax=Anguilla anguilla TaxID=7936 RepID=A0A0E9SMB9_ANGAN
MTMKSIDFFQCCQNVAWIFFFFLISDSFHMP